MMLWCKTKSIGPTMLDQALVSATSLITITLVARLLGPADFGVFSLAQIYLLAAALIQGSIVCTPMSTVLSSADSRQDCLGAFFSYGLLVNLLGALATVLMASMVGRFFGSAAIPSQVALVLLPWMLAYQLYDWCRRACYAVSAIRVLVIADLVGGTVQISLLANFLRIDEVGASECITALIAGLLPAIALMLNGLRPRVALRPSLALAKSQVKAGCHYLVSNQLQWAGSSGVLLIGAAATHVVHLAGIRAVQNVLGPINVVFQWLENMLPPRMSRLEKDRAGASRELVQHYRIAGTLAFVFAGLVTYACGEWLLRIVYGPQFARFEWYLVLFLLYQFIGYLYRLESFRIRVTGRTAILIRANLVWALVGVGAVMLMQDRIGGGYAMLAALCLGAAAATLIVIRSAE